MIIATSRPFVITFEGSAHEFVLSSVEAQRMLDAYAPVETSPDRVVLEDKAFCRATLRPATLGGGPAFILSQTEAK